MAVLYISEFSQLPITDNGSPSFGMTPGIDQKASITTVSTASSSFNVNTRFVRLHTDAICSIAFSASGANAVATANNARMAANTTEYFGVQGGGQVAVITNS